VERRACSRAWSKAIKKYRIVVRKTGTGYSALAFPGGLLPCCQQDHNDMLSHGKAAAYFDPWKFKIERLAKGDVVFLYQSGVGIVVDADGGKAIRKFIHDSRQA